MGLPTALRNADEEANELIRQQSEGKQATPESGNTATNQPEQPSQNRTPDPQPAPDSGTNWEEQCRILNSKYSVLQGKYNSETKRLREALEAAESRTADPAIGQRVQQLESENTTLRQQLEAAQQASAQSMDVQLDPSIQEEYGDDIARVFGQQQAKIAELTKQLSGFREELSNNTRVTQQTTASLLDEKLTVTLKASNIDFTQTNEDPLFIDWLKEIDPASGDTRHNLLTRAYNAGDVERTAYFFRAFKAQEGSRFQNNPLSEHVDVTSRAPTDTGSDDNVWTRQQINQLYEDYRNKKLTRAEFEEWERKLYAATQAGNIID